MVRSVSGGNTTEQDRMDLFRALAETTPDAIIAADDTNRIVYANPAAHSMAGHAPGSLIGCHVTTIVPERLRDLHAQGFERYARTREPHLVGRTVPVPLLRADGSELPVELSLGVVGSGPHITVTALIRDASEAQRRQRLATAQIAVTSVLTQADEDEHEQQILAALAGGLEWDVGLLWRVAGDHLALQELWEADPARTAPFVRDCAGRTFASGQGAPGIAWQTHQPVWIEDLRRQGLFPREAAASAAGLNTGVALPVVIGGEAIAVLELFTRGHEHLDTALREMLATVATQIGESLRRRQHAAELARSNTELEHFASTVAHDLHDPLRTVAGFAELLQAGRATEAERAEFLRLIATSAQRGQRILDGLLELARFGAGELTTAEVPLDAVLEDAVVALRSRVEETGARIEHEALPAVRCDHTLLSQVFQNLLSNAMKFRGEDAPHIRVLAHRLPGSWRIDVADNGRGVGEDQPVFDLFHRTHSGDDAGLGIGLAVCRRIIDRHGGSIWFDSRPGAGTTFRFTLPD